MSAKKKTPEDDAGAPATSPATVVVTLEEEGSADIGDVKQELEEAGLEVDQVLDFIGQIVGRWPAGDVAPLRRIKGVAAVEESREIQLPPPGSLIQ